MNANLNAAQNLLQEAQMAMQSGKTNHARTLLKKLNERAPSFDAAFLLALSYAQQENFKMATNYFRRAVELNPSIPEGHFNLGYALQCLEDYAQAASAYRNAIKVHEDYHTAWHNLGAVQEKLGEFDDALKSYDKALALDVQAVETLYSRGSLLMKMNRNKEALLDLDRALELSPLHAKAFTNRGLVYANLNRLQEALQEFDKAISIDPEDAELHFNKGAVFTKMGLNDLATKSYARCLEIDPDYHDAGLKLGSAQEQSRQYSEAIVTFEKYKRKRPDAPFVDGYMHSSRMFICDWQNYEASTQNILEKLRAGKSVISPHTSLLLGTTAADQRLAAEIWTRDLRIAIKEIPLKADRPKNEKIRIGYFSPDYHSHPVSILMAPVFEAHDRDRFEIFAFSLGPPARDAMRLRVERGVDHFINIRDLSSEDALKCARDWNIDIALDLSGFTAHNRFDLFLNRIAPVQVNYLGYSGTIGCDALDYIIADPTLIPEDHAPNYVEKVARLPDCYMPGDLRREISTRPMTRTEYGLPEKGFVYCGFNNTHKITPMQFDLWMRILKSVPDSVLWISPASSKAIENLRLEAKRRGVDGQRIIVANREEKMADHLARHQLADLFLDALPHNAHATSNDALLAGLPMLARLGEAYAGRVAGSLICALGMSDMIMPDAEAYVARAIEIGTTPGLSQQLKDRLAALRTTSPLFNTKTYTRNLEKAFEHMMARYEAGLPPASFNVE